VITSDRAVNKWMDERDSLKTKPQLTLLSDAGIKHSTLPQVCKQSRLFDCFVLLTCGLGLLQSDRCVIF